MVCKIDFWFSLSFTLNPKTWSVFIYEPCVIGRNVFLTLAIELSAKCIDTY